MGSNVGRRESINWHKFSQATRSVATMQSVADLRDEVLYELEAAELATGNPNSHLIRRHPNKNLGDAEIIRNTPRLGTGNGVG